MAEMKKVERARSADGEMQAVGDDILSNTTFPNTSEAVAAAKALGIEPADRTSIEKDVITADTILQGFKKLANGVIELTLPQGTTIQEAGEILNAAAREKGMKCPVFYEGNKEFVD